MAIFLYCLQYIQWIIHCASYTANNNTLEILIWLLVSPQELKLSCLSQRLAISAYQKLVTLTMPSTQNFDIFVLMHKVIGVHTDFWPHSSDEMVLAIKCIMGDKGKTICSVITVNSLVPITSEKFFTAQPTLKGKCDRLGVGGRAVSIYTWLSLCSHSTVSLLRLSQTWEDEECASESCSSGIYRHGLSFVILDGLHVNWRRKEELQSECDTITTSDTISICFGTLAFFSPFPRLHSSHPGRCLGGNLKRPSISNSSSPSSSFKLQQKPHMVK